MKPSPIFSMIFGSSVLLAFILFVGRMFGLLREAILASRFGLSAQGDMAALLLSLPDLLLALVVAGGMSAALVPRLTNGSREQAAYFVRIASALVLVVFGLIALAFSVAPLIFFGILAPGASVSIEAIPKGAIIMTAIALPVAALSGVTAAWLNAQSKFLLAGMGALFFNCGVIIMLLLEDQQERLLLAVASGVLVGATLRLTSQLCLLPVHDLARKDSDQAALRPFLGDFFAGSGAVMVALLPPVILRAFASFFGAGSFVALTYGQRLVELPNGVMLSAIATVALTAMSRSSEKGDAVHAANVAVSFTRQAILVGSVATCTAVLFAEPAVRLVLGYGAMRPEDVIIVAKLFAIGCLALPFSAVALLGTRYLYATGRAKAVLVPTGLALVATPVFAIPALLVGDRNLLMVCYVLVQVVLAAAVWRRTGIAIWARAASSQKSARSPLLDARFCVVTLLSPMPVIAAFVIGRALDLTSDSIVSAGILVILGGVGALFGCGAGLLWPKGRT